MVLHRIFYDIYYYWVEKKADLRTKDWFLVSSPWTVVSILVFYVFFCKILGPRLMKNRQPFELKYVMLAYNGFQVLMNFYVASHIRLLKTGYYNPLCIPLDYSDHPVALTIVNATYWFYINKYIELLDTVFMVLRKKARQISFFHVVHHATAVFALFIGSRYMSSGNGLVLGFLNATSHVVMYSYYFLATLGPQYQKYLWWKRHVTHVQMVQLTLVILQAAYGISTGCGYPKLLDIFTIIGVSFFLNLFRMFYFSNYIGKKANVKTAIAASKID